MTTIIDTELFLSLHNQRSDSVTYVNPEYKAKMHRFLLTEAFDQGIDKIQELLPQLPNESKETYNQRVKASTLKNFVTRLSQNTQGQIFRKDPQIQDLKAPFTERFLESKDIDGNKNTWKTLAKEVTYKLVRDGAVWLVIDAPKENIQGDPYMRVFNRSQVINWREEDNKLTLVVIKDKKTIPNGEYGYKVIDTYRAYSLKNDKVVVKEYELDSSSSVANPDPVLIQETVTDFSQIPVIRLSIDQEPLYDVARINLRHMHFSSLLDRYMTMTVLPQPLFWGVDADEDGISNPSKPALVLGVEDALFFHGEKSTADFEWRELSGTSISLMKEYIQSLEEDMLNAFERSKNESNKTNESATTSVIKNSANTAFLKNIAKIVEDSFQKAFTILAEIFNEDFNGQVVINTDFTPQMETSNASVVLQAYAQGVISHETVLESLNAMEITDIKDINEEINKTFNDSMDSISMDSTPLV